MSGLQLHILDIQKRRRRLDADCEFFVEGNYERFTSFRITSLAPGSEMEVADDQPTRECITCNEIGCRQKFYSLRKYAEHRFQCHQHQCSVCGKSFLSDRQLSIHISELHDSYFAAMAQRSPSFECLVEACTVMSWSDTERRKHLLGDHKFHPSFDFHNPKRHQQKHQKARQRALGQPQKDSALPETGGEDTTQNSMQVEQTEGAVEEAVKDVNAGAGPPANRASRRTAKQQSYRAAHGDAPEATADADSVYDGVSRVEISTSARFGCCSSSPPQQSRTSVAVEEGKFASSSRATPSADQESPVISLIPRDQQVMDVEDSDLADLTSRFNSASIHVPNKISFGRRKGNR
ncbi:hypothetical protein B484DRAFT_447192 [Ochromonadaceae sp. CCMP2298]|nr:hypothetical protein B484DRAFT_447192 [Ochromonadaceae sp. CCMP2298]